MRRNASILIVLALLLLMGAAVAAAREEKPIENFTAFAASLGTGYYARNHPSSDGGRRIVPATNRRVSFREAANTTRSMQYQFTLIEIHIEKNGKGDGKIVPAAKITWDKDAKRIEIENYSALPVDLLQVTQKMP